MGTKVSVIPPYIVCVVPAAGHVIRMVSHCPFEVHIQKFRVVLSDSGWCQMLMGEAG